MGCFPPDRQTKRQTDRQTDRKTDRERDRQRQIDEEGGHGNTNKSSESRLEGKIAKRGPFLLFA